MANFITTVLLFSTGFTLPLSYIHLFAIGPIGVTPNKLLTGSLLALTIVFGVVERRSMPRNPKGWWVAALASSMVIGTTITFAQGARADQIAGVASVLAAVVIFYFLLVYVIRSPKDLDNLLVGLIAGVALSWFSVLMQWGSVKAGRTGGLSGDPNNYAFVSAMTLPIVGYYFSTARSQFVKLILAGNGVLSLVAIAASLSRTGVVVLVVMGAMWMVRFRRFDVLRIAIPVFAVLVSAIFLTSPEWRERMTTLTSTQAAAEDGSIQTRMARNMVALQAFVENPIVGVGYQQFSHWSGGSAEPDARGAIHNAYLHVMAELGLIGIIAFLGLIGATYVEYGRCQRLCQAMRARGDPLLGKLYLLAVLLQISLVGTMVGNLFLSSMRYRISWLLYALSTLVLVFARQRARELMDPQHAPATSTREFRPAHMMDTGPEQPVRA